MIFQVMYAKDEFFSQETFAAMVGSHSILDRSHFRFIANVEAVAMGQVFQLMNVVEGTELPTKLGCRSMSVGDLAIRADGTIFQCAAAGWAEVAFAGEGEDCRICGAPGLAVDGLCVLCAKAVRS